MKSFICNMYPGDDIYLKDMNNQLFCIITFKGLVFDIKLLRYFKLPFRFSFDVKAMVNETVIQ